MEGGAYGAGKAGGPFDPLTFIKKPQVIIRLVGLLFSIIVFGCISTQGWYFDKCQYNNDANACGFGTAVGVIGCLGLIGFLVLDAMFENISSVQHRKYVVIADIGFSGFWAFMYFVNFCYLADAWRRTPSDSLPKDGHGRSGVEAAIAFSFFSIACFVGLCVLAVLRYRQGVSEQFATDYDVDHTQPTPSPYSAYPSAGGESGDPYQQQPPFSGQDDRRPQGDFAPPTY